MKFHCVVSAFKTEHLRLGLFVVALLLSRSMTTVTQAGILHSINDIAGGTTVDFNSGGTLASNLAPHAIAVSPNLGTTQLAYWVTGNGDAPLSGLGVSFRPYQDTRLLSLTGGWTSLGFSWMSSRYTNVIFNAFDAQNNFLASFSVTNPGGGSWDGINAASKFVGFESTTPIAAVVIANNSGNYGTLDNLTFTNAASVSAVPEPSSLAVASMGAVALGIRRRRRFVR